MSSAGAFAFFIGLVFHLVDMILPRCKDSRPPLKRIDLDHLGAVVVGRDVRHNFAPYASARSFRKVMLDGRPTVQVRLKMVIHNAKSKDHKRAGRANKPYALAATCASTRQHSSDTGVDSGAPLPALPMTGSTGQWVWLSYH